jgi:hypothetical protein
MPYRRERYATGCSKKRSRFAECERQYSLDPVDSKTTRFTRGSSSFTNPAMGRKDA